MADKVPGLGARPATPWLSGAPTSRLAARYRWNSIYSARVNQRKPALVDMAARNRGEELQIWQLAQDGRRHQFIDLFAHLCRVDSRVVREVSVPGRVAAYLERMDGGLPQRFIDE